MTTHNIHHLPVVDDGKPVAMVTSTDLVRAQKSDPLLLIGEIGRQQDIDGLKQVCTIIPELLRSLIRAQASADQIGRLLTLITDTLTTQLIRQAMSSLGSAPAAFCWLAFGSQGRRDQTAVSDQDNGLLLADEVSAGDADYFRELANYVNEGLDRCGYRFCPGEVMASNTKWRQPLANWRRQFLEWINEPSAEALMHASIFFDMRCIYGDKALFESLQQSVSVAAAGNDIFLASLAANALTLNPPIGFFKNFVLERSGEHRHTFDMKLRGIMPINDLARVYALSKGLQEVHTIERLEKAAEGQLLTLKDARNLVDAHEFISRLRLENQGNLMDHAQKPDNHLDPSQLSSLSRHQLRDAFAVVAQAQAGMRIKFTHGLM